MKRLLLAASAALLLAACADDAPSPVAPASPRFASGDEWMIFPETMTPAETGTSTSSWEVATRFKASVAGCITKIHFYRAYGETGDNVVKLWTNSGTLLFSETIAHGITAGPGGYWLDFDLTPLVGPAPGNRDICIQPNTYYRVSVNTNTKQAKTYAYFTNNGPIVRGPLTADYSYYGQPAGSMPTQGSGSIYFIGVTFAES